MSSPRVFGRLAFLVVALSTALGGCVVASGTGSETEEPAAKTEQGSNPAESSVVTEKPEAEKTTKGTTESTSQAGGSESEPPPTPWLQAGSVTQGTIRGTTTPRPQ